MPLWPNWGILPPVKKLAFFLLSPSLQLRMVLELSSGGKTRNFGFCSGWLWHAGQRKCWNEKILLYHCFPYVLWNHSRARREKEGFTIVRVQFREEKQVSLKISPGFYYMCSWTPATGNGTTPGKQDRFQNIKIQKFCNTVLGKNDKYAWLHT